MGTFVTVGNCTQPFGRLFDALRQIYAFLPQPVVIQAGHNSVDFPDCIVFDFVSQEEFEKLIDQNELIISHAGVGSILTALEYGRRPIVIPRLSGIYAEHINEHQTVFVKEFAHLDLVTPVLSAEGLARSILDACYSNKHLQEQDSLSNCSESKYLQMFKTALDQLGLKHRKSNRICLVSACGGHLAELRKLKPIYQDYDFFHVINNPIVLPFDMKDKTYIITLCERDWRAFVNFFEALWIVMREKPDCIVSTGAWPAIPFAIIGLILRTPNIYIETMASVTHPSLTGRIMHYLACRFFFPWRQLARFFPRGEYCGLLL